MVHARDRVTTDRTVLFHGVDNGVDGADKHLTHLSQAVNSHLSQRSKQNKHNVCDKDNDIDNDVDNRVDN
eukprot:8141026-Ditylum_brightwellii.AAC.1